MLQTQCAQLHAVLKELADETALALDDTRLFK